MDQVALEILSYSEAATNIKIIREAVFQVEQGIDSALDFDGLDEIAQHIVAYLDQQLVGTARIRYLTKQLAKIERVAVLSAHRGQGIGKQIMETAIDFLDRQNMPESKVHAQSHAAAFYQKLGFQPQGEPFDEAGILHIEMRRPHPELQQFCKE